MTFCSAKSNVDYLSQATLETPRMPYFIHQYYVNACFISGTLGIGNVIILPTNLRISTIAEPLMVYQRPLRKYDFYLLLHYVRAVKANHLIFLYL